MTDRTFVIEHDAWYAEEVFARRDKHVDAAISLDFTGDGDSAVWELTWSRLGDTGLTGIRLTLLDDAWEAYVMSGFDEVLAAVMLGRLDNHTPTVAEVIDVLTRHGWVDGTVRDTPEIYRPTAVR